MTDTQVDDTPTAKMSADEVLGTLTGYDEIAIAKKFGAEVLDLMATKPLTGLRALVYIQKRRELTTPHTTQAKVDTSAYEHVMSLTVTQVQELIADVDGEDPDTGEGDSLPE